MAYATRERSRTEFAHLGAARALQVAREALPGVVDHPAGGPPRLPAGESIVGFPTDRAAQVDLGRGEHGILESSAPIALETSSGRRAPIDLSLADVGGAYEPRTSATAVRIAKRLREGVSLTGIGVSLTPVDALGAPLSGSDGIVDGASVVYANTQTDTDTVVKPMIGGFEADTILRAVDSPNHLYFRIGLPAGATLVQEQANPPAGTTTSRGGGSNSVRIVKEGMTIATIRDPSAQDAEGTVVPLTMSVSGRVLSLSVNDHSGEYDFPIEVDPEVEINDNQLVNTAGGRLSNWEFRTTSEAKFGHRAVNEGSGKEFLETSGAAEYKEAEYAFWGYQTKGTSKIFEFKAETEGKNKGNKIESFLEIQAHGTGKEESKRVLSTELENPEYARKALEPPLCPKNAEGKEVCLPTSGGEGNAVHFQQTATKSPGSSYKFSDTMYQGIVEISEKAGTHSTTHFNTTSPEVEGEIEEEGKKVKQKRPNALYGSGGWLSKYQDALEPIAEDTGVGVAATKLEYESSPGKWELLSEHNYLEKENGCHGVQCYEKHTEYWTVNPKLPNGEDKIRYSAKEAVSGTESTEAEGVATVKVDTSPPHGIVVEGLPYGNELAERPYELTVEATDGEGSTVPSSGVKSIALYIDNELIGINGGTHEKEGSEGKCSVAKGECTASAKWTINGAELGAGHHSIQVVALDNAKNEGRLPGGGTEITIRHSTPVTLGPGSVDLESGDFSLGATDVSMGSGLTVSRSYSSRATNEGAEGPLGPQWSISLTNTDSLVELVDGSLLMTAANGSQTIFAKPLTGVKCESGAPFESPPGDSNLKLWCEENKTTKAREAYFLEDAADHTKVKFALPSSESKIWVPVKQEGTVATDTVTYSYKAIEHETEYPLPPQSNPTGITSGSNQDLWVSEGNTGKISKIATSGAVTEYTIPAGGVPSSIVPGPEGNLWYANLSRDTIGKMTPAGAVTEYTIGSSYIDSIAVGPENDIWFVATKGTIGKITTAGVVTEYTLPAESEPNSITAGPDGNMWYTNDYCGSRYERKCSIGKITTSGTVTNYALSGSPNHITAGPDGNLWFTAVYGYKGKIDKITTAGVITEYSIPNESYPQGITAGPDEDLWYTDEESGQIGKITTSGTVTEYALPVGSEPRSITTGPDGNLWFTDYKTSRVGTITPSGEITVPTEALAPVPASVSCAPELKAGCRALKFEYAAGITAKGENESEWGEYRGHLSKVLLDTYNPSSKKMQETTVADYSYDSLGRLRAEWDPRISPALKTVYGYDREGHVTALNLPGQEPWSFTYGTGKGDAGTGRLLKATLAPTAAGLWSGEVVKNSEAPKITGSPIMGTRLAVSNGKWSGSPLTYGYQWEECTSEGDCAPILGANDANYTPVADNVGHTLVAQVTATNGGGSEIAMSVATAAVSEGDVTQSIDSGNSINAVSCIPSTTDCVVSDSKGNAFYATNVSATSNATWSSWSGPSGQSPSQAVDCPTTGLCLLADGKGAAGGNLYYATSLGGSFSEAYSPSYGVDAISCVSSSFCVDGQDGGGYFRYSTSPASALWTLEEQGESAMSMKGVFCLSSSFCAIADSLGRVHVANSTSQIESSSWKETDVDGSTALNGIACVSTTSCVAVDGAGSVLNLSIESSGAATASKHDIDGSNDLTAVTCSGSSTCVAVDYAGNVFVSTNGGETWTKQYLPGGKLTSVSCASSSLCATVNTTGSVTVFNPTSGTGTEGELHSPGPGITIDYEVPTSGAGAPYDMSASEIAKWGQKGEEAPVEATAVFPADSPQGWPASSYTRATIYYLDEQGRDVNVAQPTNSSYGAISTTEYNEFNDVVRTLTPGNRETALKEGCESEAKCKSSEVSKLLDTENTYNGEGAKEGEVVEPGTQLVETVGPQHLVKYTHGEEQYEQGEKAKEALARSYTKYHYNEGAPSENKRTHQKETYDLVTKTENYAELSGEFNHERQDVRTKLTSYSGQENLGWALRAPTSTTVNPGSLKLTTTTTYNETTGQVTETREAGAESTLTYASKFGEAGSEPGQLKTPFGVAIDTKGDLWVTDGGNNRIEEFNSEGKYLKTFGKAGSGAGQLKEPKGIAIDSSGNLWVAESGNNRIQEFSPEGASLQVFGKAGSGSGELKEPKDVAIDSKGDVWVADSGNNRIEEFSGEGKYLGTIGKLGSGLGELKEPKGLAIDSKGDIWVADTGNNRIQEFSPEGTLLNHFGASGGGAGQFKSPFGLTFDTAGNLLVIEQDNDRVQEFSPSGAFITQFGWKGSAAGQLTEPRYAAVNAQDEVWVTDTTDNRLEKFSKGPNAHDSKVVYYSSEENKEGYPACGNHPEWAGLVCETLPVKQPELAGLPKLPVTTTTYNMWNEPETVEEKFAHFNAEGKEETSTRIKKQTYDEAGRLKTSETTATGTTDTSLPKVTDEYNSSTGELEKQSTTVAEKTTTITSKHNTLGQMTEYTDADGNVAKYRYAGPEGDGLLEEMSDSSDKGESSQKYKYDATTKEMTELVDSAAGVFTASYNVEGGLTDEVYPNGMCARYTSNSVSEATGVEYLKTSNCSEKEPGVWFSETRTPSIRGEVMSRTSTLASETYGYDQSGRLTETQETPAGEGCTVRLYAYEANSNRVSSTNRKPGGEGKCATEGGTVEAHDYDEANRLTDSGIEYDSFGNVTKLPEADAEKHELKSTFYIDNAIATQEQNGVKNEYFLDPAGRVRETISGAKKTLTHYDAPGEAVAWTCEKQSGSESCESSTGWTRDIPGIDGALTAIQTNGGTPVLQLHDLEGDIVATIKDTAGETKLESTYNSTEFGVPNGGKAPPPYAWLGAAGVKSELSTGVITYGATSYVPQTGRALQSEEVEPPGAPEGTGVGAAVEFQEEPWNMQGAAREAAEAPGLEAGREREAAEAAVRAALEEEGEDPIHYITRHQARIAGEKLKNVGTWAEFWDVAFAVAGYLFAGPEEFLEGEVASVIVGTAEPIEWFHKLGKKLIGCSENKGGYPYCKVEWKERHIKVPVLGTIAEWPDFGYVPRVEMCSLPYTTFFNICLRLG